MPLPCHSHPKRTSVWNHLIYFSTELHNTNCTFGHKINTYYTNVYTYMSWAMGYGLWLWPYSILYHQSFTMKWKSKSEEKKEIRSSLDNDSFTTVQLFVSRVVCCTIHCIEYDYGNHIVGSFKIMHTINLPVKHKCLFNSNKHHDVALDCLAKKRRTNEGLTLHRRHKNE